MNLRTGPSVLVFSSMSLLSACKGEPELVLPDAPAPGTGVQYRMVTTLDPGLEIERCQFFQVPPEGLSVNHDEVRYSSGSHHVLLYKTPYTSIPQKDTRGRVRDTCSVFDCAEGATADWQITGVVAGSQNTMGDPMLNLPEGVAVHVPGGTVVLMNTHYLNASAKPLVADARVNLYTIPKEQVRAEGGMLFFYNPFIHLPGGSKGSARMRCAVRQDITLANIQSHMHKRAVGYEAFWTSADGQVKEKLYENTAWEEVPVKRFSPGKRLDAGTALDYRCDFDNQEPRTVIQGPKTTDEMCMLIGSYYPRDPMMEGCADATFIGSGDKSCGQTLLCSVSAQNDEAAFYGCIVDSCPAVAKQMSDALKCTFTRGGGACMATCSQDPTKCQDCVQKACEPQINACLAAKC